MLCHPAAFDTPFTLKLAEWAAENFPRLFKDLKEVWLHSLPGIWCLQPLTLPGPRLVTVVALQDRTSLLSVRSIAEVVLGEQALHLVPDVLTCVQRGPSMPTDQTGRAPGKGEKEQKYTLTNLRELCKALKVRTH